jgi:hypothetical protein
MAALTLAALALCGTGTAAAAGSAPAAGSGAAGAGAGAGISPLTCTGVLDLTVSFSQPSYSPGQTVTVNVKAVNCTGRTLATHLMPYGRFTDAAGNIAPGCPVIDPNWNPVTFTPNGTYTTSFSYQNLASCQATQFTALNTFYEDGGAQLAASTATVPILPGKPPTGCHVAYTKQAEWSGGFNAAFSITNTGQAADTGWTLTFSFAPGQQIRNAWGAGATQTGQAVTLVNLPWDATVAPGATLDVVGLTGTWTTSDPVPSGFAINGVTCT